MKDLLLQLEQEKSHANRLQLLAELEERLEQQSNPQDRKHIKALLYHRDWYIRREAAFLIDRLGVALDDDERFQFAYALQNFPYLVAHKSHPAARRLLFQACRDAAPKIRIAASGFLTPEDCMTLEEEALWHYASGDYVALLELGCTAEGKEVVLALLREGLHQEENPNYHRRQCAFCLEQLKAISNAESVIQALLSGPDEVQEEPSTSPPPHLSPVEQLIQALNQQGIRVDGRRVYPRIEIGSVTGRITYKQPPIQTWSKQERMRRIVPEPGRLRIRFDYECMEPRIFLHFLLDSFWISLEDIPEGDLYLAVHPQDRDQGKRWLNAVINGAGASYREALNPFQAKLLEAAQEFRQELYIQAQKQGYIQTLGGRPIPLPQTGANLAGRCMNRLIQGSASDIFNTAVAHLYLHFVEAMEPARISLLLFDEVWIEVEPKALSAVQDYVRRQLERVPAEMGLLLPLNVRSEVIDPFHPNTASERG